MSESARHIQQVVQQALGIAEGSHSVRGTESNRLVKIFNTSYLQVYILREGLSHYYSTMFCNIIV